MAALHSGADPGGEGCATAEDRKYCGTLEPERHGHMPRALREGRRGGDEARGEGGLRQTGRRNVGNVVQRAEEGGVLALFGGEERLISSTRSMQGQAFHRIRKMLVTAKSFPDF